jgi:signal transduction histidine kinase
MSTMRLPEKYRSLKVHATTWVLAPLALMMIALIAMGFYSYQQVVTKLLIRHQQQLAAVTAANVSHIIDGYTLILEAVVSSNELLDADGRIQTSVLNEAAVRLDIFNAGIYYIDDVGNLGSELSGSIPLLLSGSHEDYFISSQSSGSPAILNDKIISEHNQPVIVITAPIYNSQDEFKGALLGGIHLQDSTLTDPIRLLVEGEQGFAYIVDNSGRVIFHPEPELLGIDQSDRSYIKRVIEGDSGGVLWRAPSGERLLEGYAPVPSTDWGLVVQVGWDTVSGPARTYGLLMAAAGLTSFTIVVLLAWWGVRLILNPIQSLSIQARQISSMGGIEPMPESGIMEIDTLEHALNHMAGQIESYRDGMRRYVGAITQKQEEERRHIARELHDETVQSLLAISRSLELDQAAEIEPHRLKRLTELQTLVSNTLTGVRQISRELRPLVLEDLGLYPALQALVRGVRQGEGAVPHIKLELPPEIVNLNSTQELALYRITQEALNNIRKHAQATGIRVSMSVKGEFLHLIIEDDGEGFHVPEVLSELAKSDRFGLMGIQERVWALGGSLTIHSSPGEGACLSIIVPSKHLGTMAKKTD